MEQQIVSVKHVLANRRVYHGQNVSVEGMFLASLYDTILIPLSQNTEINTSNIIRLDHKNLAEQCFTTLSPWVGGQYYYTDRAIVSGLFINNADPVITQITEMQIIRDDHTFKVNLKT